MSTLQSQGIDALVKGPADVLFATLHDLIDIDGQMGRLQTLSDAIVRAKESVRRDKKYGSALELQRLQKQRDELRRTLPRARLVEWTADHLSATAMTADGAIATFRQRALS
jgi:hypothetical protein